METNLRRGIIATFGITFFLIVVMIVVWKFKFYDDVNAQLTKAGTDYAAQKTIAADLNKNQIAAAIAKDRVKLAKNELNYFQRRFRALNINLLPDKQGGDGNRNATWIRWMKEYFAEYGLDMRQELVQAAQETDVILTSTVKVNAPPQMPELVTAPPSGFLKPVAGDNISVEVAGSLPDILRFLDRINHSSILMSIGNIKIDAGTSSGTTASTGSSASSGTASTGSADAGLPKATFTISPYLLAKGPSVILAPPAGGATTTTATGEEGISSPSASPMPIASSMPSASPMPSATAAR